MQKPPSRVDFWKYGTAGILAGFAIFTGVPYITHDTKSKQLEGIKFTISSERFGRQITLKGSRPNLYESESPVLVFKAIANRDNHRVIINSFDPRYESDIRLYIEERCGRGEIIREGKKAELELSQPSVCLEKGW